MNYVPFCMCYASGRSFIRSFEVSEAIIFFQFKQKELMKLNNLVKDMKGGFEFWQFDYKPLFHFATQDMRQARFSSASFQCLYPNLDYPV